jgi:hypothetical protein
MTGLVIRDTFACFSGVEPQLVSGPLTFRRRCDRARAPGTGSGREDVQPGEVRAEPPRIAGQQRVAGDRRVCA